MNHLLGSCNLILVTIIFLYRCTYSDARDPNYIYALTEDAKVGPFGKIKGGRTVDKAIFQQKSFQRFVAVDNNGLLRLTAPLTSFRRAQGNNGVRRFTISVDVRGPSTKGKLGSGRRLRSTVNVDIIVFPVNFGDRFLRSAGRRIPSAVRMSNTFGMRMNALHRFLRVIPPRANPKASESAFTAIKRERGVEMAVEDIMKRYITKNEPKNLFIIWSLNSLFSTTALTRLGEDAECEEDPVIKCPKKARFRTINGTCNNVDNPLFGSAPNAFNRLVPARYFDPEGLNDPIGFPDQPLAPDVPNPFKVVRDFIMEQEKPTLHNVFSHAVMQWGQWLDHDLDLSPESESSDECQRVPCDGSREDFVPPCFTIEPIPGFDCIRFARSAAECQLKDGKVTVRQQINVNTAYVDGSQVYGSTDILAKELRDLTNDKGLLRVEPGVLGDFLPADNSELVAPNSFCQDPIFGGCFLAGDSRVSEQQVLATMHTLFVREHNRMAKELGKINPKWNGERIYQETRRILGAVLQKITYYDYLPIIIGNTLPVYRGYNPKVNADVVNSFATAAYRFGHSTIRPTFDILDGNFDPIGDPLSLRTLFFNNSFIRQNGIDPLLLGLLKNASETVDSKLAAPLLNNLFERIDSPALNLAALNIQRGRDHGLPGYNAFRRYCGLKDAKSFKDTRREIPSRRNRKILAKLYNDNPDLADLWPAGLAEAPANGGIVGATFGCIIREQLRRARDGDSFFYKRPGVFTKKQVYEIEKTTLSRILCDNLQTIVSVQKNAFLAGRRDYRRVACNQIPGIDLSAWRERINPCNPNPCLNRGKCIRKNSRYYVCSCRYGYRGKRCQARPSQRACKRNICRNGGRCTMIQRGRTWRPKCYCRSGYRGRRCSYYPG